MVTSSTMYLACSNFWRRSSIDGNTLACILSQDSKGRCDFHRKPRAGWPQLEKWSEILGISGTSKGCKARIPGISATESKCADERTLAGPRMALEGRTPVLLIQRCDRAFRSRGTPTLEPGSSRAAG